MFHSRLSFILVLIQLFNDSTDTKRPLFGAMHIPVLPVAIRGVERERERERERETDRQTDRQRQRQRQSETET